MTTSVCCMVAVPCLLQTQILEQKHKRAKIIGMLLGHVGCITQLCSIAGGRGQCDEILQLKALQLLQETASKPRKATRSQQSGGSKTDKAPLVGVIMESVPELLGPLLQGLRLRPIRNDSMLALLQLHLSLVEQAPKLLAELLNQDGTVSLLGLLASSDATEQIHEVISKLLRTMSQSALYGHLVEDALAIFLPQAVVAALLVEPAAASDQVHAQNGTFRLGQRRRTHCFSRVLTHKDSYLSAIETLTTFSLCGTGNEQRKPELIWTAAMNTRFRQAVDAALAEHGGAVPPERTPLEYHELSKEQYIGGVYLREFLRAPQTELRSVEKFTAALMEAHLVHAADGDGVKKLGPICAATLTAVTLHPEMAVSVHFCRSP